DLHTVGAGGGSLVTRDAGGALRVGPESAGARPGPACYGAGGGATVTDANLLLGRLPSELSGGLVLDRAAAESALGDIDPQAVIDVVNAEMLRALRVVSVERGHDPRDFPLVAFGGAFHRAHEERYGHAEPEREIELVAVRTADVTPGPDVSLQVTDCYTVVGPALLELSGATCWVPAGWHGETNGDGTLVLRR